MKKFFGTMAVAAALFAGYSAYDSLSEDKLTGIVLANIEALANGAEGGSSTHTLVCTDKGLKICEATCGRCNVTLKSIGTGGTVSITCPL